MEAAVYHKYGSVDVVKTGSLSPPEPGPGDVLVRVLVSQVTAGDIRIRSSDFPGIFWLPARIFLGCLSQKIQCWGWIFAESLRDPERGAPALSRGTGFSDRPVSGWGATRKS